MKEGFLFLPRTSVSKDSSPWKYFKLTEIKLWKPPKLVNGNLLLIASPCLFTAEEKMNQKEKRRKYVAWFMLKLRSCLMMNLPFLIWIVLIVVKWNQEGIFLSIILSKDVQKLASWNRFLASEVILQHFQHYVTLIDIFIMWHNSTSLFLFLTFLFCDIFQILI